MMGPIGITVLVLALAGAAASWVVGAVYYFRCLAAVEGTDRNRLRLQAMVAWPFTLGRLRGSAAEHAAVVNKAIVAFFVCLTVAAAAVSLSTNFNRISK
jgi:hypothetical protein